MNNQLERVTQPDGTYSEYRYDGVGRVVTQTNALLKNTTYRYEDNIRRVTVTAPLGNVVDPSGHILETVADGVAIGMDLHDIQSEGLN